MPRAEIYQHWSHFNFHEEQWREAAARYLELLKAMDQLEIDDEEVDHDALGEQFLRCDICNEISDLQDARDDFAREFAGTWAKKAIEGGEAR